MEIDSLSCTQHPQFFLLASKAWGPLEKKFAHPWTSAVEVEEIASNINENNDTNI